MPNQHTGPRNNMKEPTQTGAGQPARALAADHHTWKDSKAAPPLIRRRLAAQKKLLQANQHAFSQTVRTEFNYSTAAEWFLDNYYVIQQTVRQVSHDLPASYYQELPKLDPDNAFHPYPRVFALARHFVIQEKCYTNLDTLHHFVDAYQEIHPLTMGEVWALPIMLRFCLLECLAQIATRITGTDFSPELAPPDQPLRFEINAPDSEIIANSILSLRLIDSHNWRTFFEETNRVEQILRRDPAGLYSQMTFKSCDRYRKIVEKLARSSSRSEQRVAKTAVRLARSAASPPQPQTNEPLNSPPAAHVGYYLVDQGREELANLLDIKTGHFSRWRQHHLPALYVGSILLLTVILLALLLVTAVAIGSSWWQLVILGLLSLIPLSGITSSILNWVAAIRISPRLLPRLDFATGIPASCRTMVVIPALLSSKREIRSLISQLEQHYLRNPDPQLGFALLTDFADAPAAQMPEDEGLLQAARQQLEGLNGRYPGTPFFLFHRRRLFNPGEDSWMGWERKRGKLHQFNRLLRGEGNTSFTVQDGDLSFLSTVKFVITLDADTVLPADTAARLTGTMAHPLNRARCDQETGQVTAGYSILQPRTEIKPAIATKSPFTRIFGGGAGLNLYNIAVSDVYQDLFGEGIYMGKGIYDVAAFECSLKGRVPENSLLSHDLFEGVLGRAGLISDIVLFEDFPPNYFALKKRSHRWIRGDWQLLPWLMRRVPAANGRRPNDLSLLSRWKIADNLRRSLVSPALFLYFALAWLLLPPPAWLWMLIGLLLTAAPLLTTTAMVVRRRIGGAGWQVVGSRLRLGAARWLLQIIFLPFDASINLHAAGITLWRLLFTRRRLLQWTTAAHSARLLGNDAATRMARISLITLLPTGIVTTLVAYFRPELLLSAAPLLLLWLCSPLVAWQINRHREEETAVLTPAASRRLRTLARRTWLFFEEFVGPEDNWLPPDHYQEEPRGVVAHRTSPTNIGLYLLTALAASDLGFISLLNLSLRIGSCFDTLDRLERHRGHFLNWLDTTTLHHLNPRYVSTVDSGNLAGCLLALKQGCLTIKEQPVWRPEKWEGLIDTIALFNELVAALPKNEAEKAIRQHLSGMQQLIDDHKQQPAAWAGLLETICRTALPRLEEQIMELFSDSAGGFSSEAIHQWRFYLDQLDGNLNSLEREMKLLTPWLPALHQPPACFTEQQTMPAPVQEAWNNLQQALPAAPLLKNMVTVCHRGRRALAQLQEAVSAAANGADISAVTAWCTDLDGKLAAVPFTVEPLLAGFDDLAARADDYVAEMDFAFLYNRQRHVFHIGFNLESSQLDNNFYDLLASEARIASIVAIAKRDIPQKHWLHLSRPLTELQGKPALLSWSGTMFEYLMPPLLMKSYPGTLLAQSCRTAVEHQIAYGREKDVPWGISESGFYTFDNARNYQYRAFGVPGAGFRRGLGDDLVITPYASFMALPWQPQAVLSNLDHLLRYQMMGTYGMYEAIDFTPSRLNLGQKAAIVRSYMAHHQGMALLGLVNQLYNDIMVDRFHAEPMIRSTELLLQEELSLSAPRQTPLAEEDPPGTQPDKEIIRAESWAVPEQSNAPQVHYLSNGRLSSLITNAGAGYLTSSDISLTRWRPDTTRDHWGIWIYVKDRDSGDLWSCGTQPVGARPENTEVLFWPHKVRFRRHDHQITLQMELTIDPAQNAEIRLVQISNDSDRRRRLQLTSCGEIVLTDYQTDLRHPAFAKLFVESDYISGLNLLIFRRRPRAETEAPRFAGHLLVAPAEIPLTGAYESDRARYIGRGRSAANPAALQQSEQWLSGSSGATLDPVMALGQELELPPHADAKLAWITIAADSREGLIELAHDYQQWVKIDKAFTGARTQAEQELRQLNLTVEELAQGQQLLSLLMYPHADGRANPAILAANSRGQPALWAYGISGDYPILLLQISETGADPLLTHLLQLHTYWRRRGLKLDLVILNEQESNYGQPVQNKLLRTIRQLESDDWLNKRGGIFIIRADQMSREDGILLRTAARVLLDQAAGPLAAQLPDPAAVTTPLPSFIPPGREADSTPPRPISRPDELLFDNGWGGFSADGREYIIYLEPGEMTPAPWINVIANEQFGFLVSASGGGYSWAGNSGENRLTSWRNDPVGDEPAEAIYLRDEETGAVWSPTPQPAPANQPYLIRHGAGYTIFEHQSHQLKQRLRLFAAPHSPVKIARLRLENRSERPRRITATYYAEWVLGTHRSQSQMSIIPSFRSEQNALLARNPYNVEFGDAVAFLASPHDIHGMTTDRTEFLGRGGSLRQPAALSRIGLSDRTPVAADPCAALQLHIDLPPGGSKEITFLLGQGANKAETEEILAHFLDPDALETAWDEVGELWEEILGAIQVETPAPAMDLLLNRWLVYQTLACRLWGRSALYQSSGAYGFRDQLQDVLALLHTRPELARAHLLRAARHQFAEGDVLHWWHPPTGRGVRTRIRDDLIWLPFATARYVQTTGDSSVLDEKAPFLNGRPLEPDEEERYGHFETSPTMETLYTHCCRALEQAITTGRHGLPLMGGGDWNDGMNRVGIEGKGESVWLGWFLAGALRGFADICAERGEDEQAEAYRRQAEAYREAIETNGWDGHWYRRAYYDDGTPLGSQENEECRLDAIAQSWAVLTGLGDSARVAEAMTAVQERLIREEERLILLFTPPFDKTRKDPGYIKGYLPGIRENGGQYTHAALWTIWAFAELGDGKKAAELYRMINPVRRADTKEKAALYKVEPYVIAADVYGRAPHEGRGGWTWYTGSSGWMYQLGIEGILGVRRCGEQLKLHPRLPEKWPGFTLSYRYGQSEYEIKVENKLRGPTQLWLDGILHSDEKLPVILPLADDAQDHEVLLRCGE